MTMASKARPNRASAKAIVPAAPRNADDSFDAIVSLIDAAQQRAYPGARFSDFWNSPSFEDEEFKRSEA